MSKRGLDPVPPPADFPIIAFDADQMLQLGLSPAPASSRLLAHASITAGTARELGFEVADAKTMIGASIISLGLQPDLLRRAIVCPSSKQRILSGQCAAVRAAILAAAGVDRVASTRLTGRLCNIAQLFPEIAAELHGGYRVGGARARSGARRLLTHVPLSATSDAGREYDRLAAVSIQVLADNEGVPLATAALFPPVGSRGLALVVSDASGDVASGDAGFGGWVWLPGAPGFAFVVCEAWPHDAACALHQSSLRPHLRSGAPRFSMPAAELFATVACLDAALDASGLRPLTTAAIAVGDCQPAAAALNRASSPAPAIRTILTAARSSLRQWLGVQVPRELNSTADLFSHPSRFSEACSRIWSLGLTPISAPLPPHHPCWHLLRTAVAASSPSDPDF